MKKKLQLFLVIIAVFCSSAAAQNADSQLAYTLPSPANEKFEDVDALASPWRVGKCPDSFYKITNCHKVGAEYRHMTRTSLYNEDGSLWYQYGNQHIDPDFYRKNTTMDFLPFASYGDFGNNAILRMVGESENWYKVEVNEETRMIKFVSKSDPHWEKTTWDFWLAKMEFFDTYKDNDIKIYDSPNGNIIGSVIDSNLRYVRYLGKREGDWAFIQATKTSLCYPVERKTEQCFPGWVRWRDGRNILIRNTREMFIITEIKTDSKELTINK